MIETSRLILRMMSKDDFNDLLRIFTDKDVMQSFNLKTFSPKQMQNWMDRNLNHQKQYNYGLYSVILKSSQELIGDCGLEHTTFEEKPCVEIGYDFLSRYWNQGYATEAASAVKDHATKNLNIDLRVLCSFIRISNKGSQRVAEKIGMQRIKEYDTNGIKYYLYAFSKDHFT
ncbi:MAG: N-acetyltransferase [Promethearchaeota archaeon]|nr:MAG: N-acetyltransferase [Candidatus Lokiarchaeota archaeon]